MIWMNKPLWTSVLLSVSLCKFLFFCYTECHRGAQSATEKELDYMDLKMLAINGQKAIRKIIPEPIQSAIINCFRVSAYFT